LLESEQEGKAALNGNGKKHPAKFCMSMQQLYIPEIGDRITLAEDWSFTLMAEDRNQDLAAWAGYYTVGGSPVRFVDPNVVPPMRDRDHKIDRTRSHEYITIATK